MLLVALPISLLAAKIRYSVHFIGIDDPSVIKTLRSVSDLMTLQGRPPASVNALKYRADSDIPELIKVLHAYGYYEAVVSIRVEDSEQNADVFVMITPGPVYVIDQFSIQFADKEPKCPDISLEEIGIQLRTPALSTKIVSAEQHVLNLLSQCGFPLAKTAQRSVIVDGSQKTVSVVLNIEEGPLCYFGPVTIGGQEATKEAFIRQKIAWKEGDLYDSLLVEQTQKSLLDTTLFSSVLITYKDKSQGADVILPMRIEVAETKHRSINIGISYQTFFGPGATFGWENRNVDGYGRRLTLQGDLTEKTHAGNATYHMPDFFAPDQDYVIQAQAMYESIFAYDDRSYNVVNRFEKRIGTKYRFSVGFKVERLFVSDSVDNGQFSLLEIPLYFRFSNANDLLDPTEGSTLEFKIIPSTNFSHPDRYYISQFTGVMLYLPVTKSRFLVLAQQLLFESVLSRSLDSVPVPKRVLGGTDQELRGYRYRSVSPLQGHKPIGGRSGIFYTLEPRFRLTKSLGLVPFLDIGSVYLSIYPNLKEKWLASTGLGLRYFTFLGPLRFDIAFPLDRRKGIDPRYRVLISLGQTF